MDHELRALLALLRATPEFPTGTPERRRQVAECAGVSADNLYQVARGVPLQSGRPRRLGRDVKERLTSAFPGWLDVPPEAPNRTASDKATQAQTTSAAVAAITALRPTLAAALERLGDELARDMPHEVREDVADALHKMAMRRGAGRDQKQVIALLVATSASNQRTGTDE